MPARNTIRGVSSLSLLISAGLLTEGQTLVMRRRSQPSVTAVVEADGFMKVGSLRFKSPSGAAKYILKRPVNGWDVWRTTSGTSLAHLRGNIGT
jgi:hypothetical protein